MQRGFSRHAATSSSERVGDDEPHCGTSASEPSRGALDPPVWLSSKLLESDDNNVLSTNAFTVAHHTSNLLRQAHAASETVRYEEN
jgi:hypothetical protein